MQMVALTLACVEPSKRTLRISRLEAVRSELQRHRVDAEPYREELVAVEQELLELYRGGDQP